jgi:hypothetical protein
LKTFLILNLIFITFLVNAQISFAPIGAEWIYESYDGNYYYYYKIKAEKDTLIDNKTYRLLTRNDLVGNFVKKNQITRLDSHSYIGQFESLVFRRINKIDHVLYFFDLEVGDIFPVVCYDGFSTEMKIIDIIKDPINIDYLIQKVRIGLRSFTIHPKFGILDEDLLYNERICYVDIPSVKLRCYFENGAMVRNFDNIPCDSFRRVRTQIDVENLRKYEVTINPNTGQIQIHNKSNVSHNNSIIFFDLNGRKVLDEKINNSSTEIDITFLSNGLYFYHIIDFQRVIQRGRIFVTNSE